MCTQLLVRFLISFAALHSAVAKDVAHKSNKSPSSKHRNIRSPGLNIETEYHQTFNFPVSFNKYISSGGGGCNGDGGCSSGGDGSFPSPPDTGVSPHGKRDIQKVGPLGRALGPPGDSGLMLEEIGPVVGKDNGPTARGISRLTFGDGNGQTDMRGSESTAVSDDVPEVKGIDFDVPKVKVAELPVFVKETYRNKVFPIQFDLSNFPLDLYFMQDATQSFDSQRAALTKMAPQFLDGIKRLSKDYQLGFGLFGDKFEWNSKGYGFYNLMPLTKDTKNFAKTVAGVEHIYRGSGHEHEEDPLTAIHQAAVCKKNINWRDNVLRVLLMTTDEDYLIHKISPRDNRTKWDNKCHLDANDKVKGDYYAWESEYPTIDTIKNALKENTIQIVFAVSKSRKTSHRRSMLDHYRELANKIDAPIPIVKELDTNGGNLIQLVKEAYEEIGKTAVIETSISGPAETIEKVNVKATCKMISHKARHAEKKFTSICHMPNSKIVGFEVDVTLPCHLDTSGLKLTTNIKGYSAFKTIDLKDICHM